MRLRGISTRRVSAIALTVVALAAVVTACGPGANKHAGPAGLLDQIQGARTRTGALIIDERDGRVGALRLGMPLSAAKKVLSAAYYWGAMTPGTDASYCSRPRGNTCGGVSLQLVSGCTTPPTVPCSPNGHGPVYEIELDAATNPADAPESADAVTLRGIRLGTPGREISRVYTITDVGGTTCAGNTAAPAKNYIAVSGDNTLAITVYQRVVWSITLISGRYPHYCSAR